MKIKVQDGADNYATLEKEQKSIVAAMADAFINLMGDIWNAAVDLAMSLINMIWDWIVEQVMKIWNAVIEPLIEAVEGYINGIIESMQEFFGEINDFDWDGVAVRGGASVDLVNLLINRGGMFSVMLILRHSELMFG